MADKDRGKGKASKGRQLKLHLRRPSHVTPTCVPSPSAALSPAITSHAAPQPRTSHAAPPPGTSHAAPPPGTSHAAPPPGTSHAASQPGTSHAAPQPGTSHAAPHPRTSHTTPPSRTSHVTPPPSMRGVESPTNQHASFSEDGPTPGSNETIVASETQSNGGKPILYLEGQGFLPSHPAANGIGDILKSHYTDPWPSWKKIPSTTRDLWFEEFKKKFSFCPLDDWWARKNFEIRGAALMKNNLNKARTLKKKPCWIGNSVWDRLCEHWRTQDYKKKSIQGKTNRASDCGGSLHTGGSITTSQHRANMMKLTGTLPNPADLFRRTHQRRKDNTWVDRRSEQVNEEFTRTWEELTQAASSQGTTPPSQLDVWRNVAGVKKGKIYGLGMESTVVVRRPYYRGSCSSSTEWVQRQELDELRNQMEEVRTERDQLRVEMANTNKEMENTKRACERNNKLIKQLMKSMKFQQMPFTEEQADDDQELDSEGQPDDDDQELDLD